jgi:pyruvate dehydrogenase (quinone)
VVLVLNNGDLNTVTWEMRETEGDPRFPASQRLPELPYAAYAQLLGLGGRRIDSADEVEDAWDDALASPRPFLLEAVVDPAVPLLPPHLEEASRERLEAAFALERTTVGQRAHQALQAELAMQTRPED